MVYLVFIQQNVRKVLKIAISALPATLLYRKSAAYKSKYTLKPLLCQNMMHLTKSGSNPQFRHHDFNFYLFI